jgi:AcrR family transcriptional regulator
MPQVSHSHSIYLEIPTGRYYSCCVSTVRQERGVRTRRHILETAATAFAQDGYAATSLNAIVAASGLTKGAFYYHFPSKEELALSTFRFKQEQLVARAITAVAGAPDAPSALRALFRVRAAALREDGSLRAVLRLGAEFRAQSVPDPAFVEFQELAIEAFADLIRRGQDEGTMRRGLDPRVTAEVLFGAMVGMDDVSHFLSGGDDLEQRSEALLDVVIDGIAAARETPGKPRKGSV